MTKPVNLLAGVLLLLVPLFLIASPASAGSEPYGYCQVTHLTPFTPVNSKTPLSRLVIIQDQLNRLHQLISIESTQAPSPGLSQSFFDSSITLSAAGVDLNWAMVFEAHAQSSHQKAYELKAASMLTKFDAHLGSINHSFARINGFWPGSCARVKSYLAQATQEAKQAVSASAGLTPQNAAPSFFGAYVNTWLATNPTSTLELVEPDPNNPNQVAYTFAQGYQVCLSAYTLSPQEQAC